MLLYSLCLIGAAGTVGLGLAVWYLQSEGRHIPHWAFGLLHATLAIAGFALLLVVLSGPEKGALYGAPLMGRIAAGFLVLALLTGLLPVNARLRRRRLPLPSLVIGMHATMAISGIVILAAFYTLVG